ncbi:MAG: RluA family pseudouridine synthase [Treponema sp.]|jgi:23S rRNA pseudouridine1911/1915/1917 synthase|nr:RluA family pseudouridine synthase [Treponema sp.]
MPEFSCVVGEDFAERRLRLDRYVAECLGLLSRSRIKTLGLEGRINGRPVKLSRPVKRGDRLELRWAEAEPLYAYPENIPLDVLYEDERVIVINKAQGMVVHPGAGNRSGTLVNALLWRFAGKGEIPPPAAVPEKAAAGGPGAPAAASSLLRPGIVHRLDKDTSGVIIAARDDEALAFLAEQFRARRAGKTYAALVPGAPERDSGRVETMIARDVRDRKRFAVSDRGKSALTLYRVVKKWETHSLVLLRPKTGRTHQLRVHLRYLGHPVCGDPVYGFTDPLFPGASLMLHALSLRIVLPGRNTPRLFRAPLPERFREIFRVLEGRSRIS